jgi:hypothetical protein
VTVPLSLLAAHFVGDFLLQSDWMATNKSKHWDVLAIHATVYSLCFAPWGFTFLLVTLVTHFATDAVTSRITARLWFLDLYPRVGLIASHGAYPFYARIIPNRRHWFFVFIGLDQLLHYIALAWTLALVG